MGKQVKAILRGSWRSEKKLRKALSAFFLITSALSKEEKREKKDIYMHHCDEMRETTTLVKKLKSKGT